MVPTFSKKYRKNDELRIGWASWDKGKFRSRSIKFAYRDESGKISRGCPELPFDVLVDMVILAHQQGEFDPKQTEQIKNAFGKIRAKEGSV